MNENLRTKCTMQEQNITVLTNKCEEYLGELERTKKQLEIAVDALKELRPTEKRHCYLVPTVSTTQRIIDKALEQINNITKGGKDEMERMLF